MSTRIYIVEDNHIVAKNIELDLKQNGYEVLGQSAKGEVAIKEILKKDPDLVLMDINLNGEMTGIDVAREVNTVRSIPVVFLSAYADEDTITKAKEVGAFGFIVKPFQSIDLTTAIEVALTRFSEVNQVKSESEKSKLALIESERRYQQIIENVSDLIYRVNLRGEFTYVNSAISRITGYEADEILDRSYLRLIREDYRNATREFYENMYNEKIDKTYFEFPMYSKEGEVLWIGQNVQLLYVGEHLVGFQAMARDITERVNFQEELIEAKEKAESAAKVKTQFLANMSHEIRTPLNGIVGISNLLAQTELNEKQRYYMNAIISSTDQLMGIINNILDISKIEAGRMRIENKKFNLIEVTKTAVDLFEGRAQEKQLKLNYYFVGDVPKYVKGDAVKLNQILYNLVGNALKFTEEGEVSVKVRVFEEKDDKVALEFCVCDTGIGIPEDKLVKVFSAFSQVENDAQRKHGGSGLGLSIVKKLVDLQGGKINVESELCKGSMFRVVLDFELAEVEETEEVNSQPENVVESLKGVKILLAEDNPVNQLVTNELLKVKEASVDIVENGEEAIHKYYEEDYDIILMDMQMPVMDGYTAMKNIRSSETNSHIPILALTAHAFEGELERCIEAGADDYLSKPFAPDQLYQKIVKLINKGSDELNTSSEDVKLTNEEGSDYLNELNLEILNSFLNSDKSLIKSTLEVMVNTFEGDIKLLKNHFENKNISQIKGLMHKNKSSLQMIGMKSFKALCEKLEKESEDVVLENTLLVAGVLQEITDYLKQNYFQVNETQGIS